MASRSTGVYDNNEAMRLSLLGYTAEEIEQMLGVKPDVNDSRLLTESAYVRTYAEENLSMKMYSWVVAYINQKQSATDMYNMFKSANAGSKNPVMLIEEEFGIVEFNGLLFRKITGQQLVEEWNNDQTMSAFYEEFGGLRVYVQLTLNEWSYFIEKVGEEMIGEYITYEQADGVYADGLNALILPELYEDMNLSGDKSVIVYIIQSVKSMKELSVVTNIIRRNGLDDDYALVLDIMRDFYTNPRSVAREDEPIVTREVDEPMVASAVSQDSQLEQLRIENLATTAELNALRSELDTLREKEAKAQTDLQAAYDQLDELEPKYEDLEAKYKLSKAYELALVGLMNEQFVVYGIPFVNDYSYSQKRIRAQTKLESLADLVGTKDMPKGPRGFGAFVRKGAYDDFVKSQTKPSAPADSSSSAPAAPKVVHLDKIPKGQVAAYDVLSYDIDEIIKSEGNGVYTSDTLHGSLFAYLASKGYNMNSVLDLTETQVSTSSTQISAIITRSYTEAKNFPADALRIVLVTDGKRNQEAEPIPDRSMATGYMYSVGSNKYST